MFFYDSTNYEVTLIGVIKQLVCAFVFIFMFSLVNLTSALKRNMFVFRL